MKKIISCLFCLLFAANCLAATEFCASALEWWLEKQNKFEGAQVCTQEIEAGSGQFVITKWVVKNIPQPSEDEIKQIIKDYKKYIKDKTDKESADKEVSIQKLKNLGLTEDEINAFLKHKPQ
jgi:hypothetical protein